MYINSTVVIRDGQKSFVPAKPGVCLTGNGICTGLVRVLLSWTRCAVGRFSQRQTPWCPPGALAVATDRVEATAATCTVQAAACPAIVMASAAARGGAQELSEVVGWW